MSDTPITDDLCKRYDNGELTTLAALIKCGELEANNKALREDKARLLALCEHGEGGCAVSETYAIVDPMMTLSGGCAGYTTIYKGTMEECLAKRPSGGQRIVTADEETEVAWECDRKWITDIDAAKGGRT